MSASRISSSPASFRAACRGTPPRCSSSRLEHIAYIISEAIARGATTVEPSQQAQDDWVKTIREVSVDTSEFAVSCTPGYYNNEGGGGGEGIRSAIGENYAPGFYEFGDLIKEWRDKGDLEGLVLGA